VGNVSPNGEKSDARATQEIGLNQSESHIGGPVLGFRPSGRAGRIQCLRFNAPERSILDLFSPQRPADRRHGVRVIERYDRVEPKLSIIHSLGADHIADTVRVFGADPGDVGALAGGEFRHSLKYNSWAGGVRPLYDDLCL